MIPHYLKRASDETQQKYRAVYDRFASRGEMVAKLAADTWLKNHVIAQREYVASRNENRITVRFVVDTSKEFIKRSDSGEEYILAMLQDVHGDVDGFRWEPEWLQSFADQINRGEGVVGDIDHVEYDRLMSKAFTDEQVEAMLRSKKGIAKAVQAVFENGQLWVKAQIDKRYKKALQGRNVSLEAVFDKDEGGRVVDAKLLGWTFIVDDPAGAANLRTAVVDA
jgi:hypothetical protein